MPRIPTNPSELPSAGDRFGPLDEGLTYRGTIEMLGEGIDKNQHNYITVRIKVTEPEEYVDRVVYDNYVALPWMAEPWMDAKQRKMAEQSGDKLGDLARSAGIKGSKDGWDTDDLLNCEIMFTVTNEEYQGQTRSKPRAYLAPKELAPPF